MHEAAASSPVAERHSPAGKEQEEHGGPEAAPGPAITPGWAAEHRGLGRRGGEQRDCHHRGPGAVSGSGRWTSRASYGNPTYRKREARVGTMLVGWGLAGQHAARPGEVWGCASLPACGDHRCGHLQNTRCITSSQTHARASGSFRNDDGLLLLHHPKGFFPMPSGF